MRGILKWTEGECLPREGFLAVVYIPLAFAIAHRASQVVCQRARSTAADAGSADTFLHLLVYQGLHVWLTREHLDTRAGRVDLLRTPGPSDEEKDLENLATARHRQNLGHPGTDPLEMFRGLDDPDEGEAASGGSTIGVSSDNVADMRNLVRDTNTSSP